MNVDFAGLYFLGTYRTNSKLKLSLSKATEIKEVESCCTIITTQTQQKRCVCQIIIFWCFCCNDGFSRFITPVTEGYALKMELIPFVLLGQVSLKGRNYLMGFKRYEKMNPAILNASTYSPFKR